MATLQQEFEKKNLFKQSIPISTIVEKKDLPFQLSEIFFPVGLEVEIENVPGLVRIAGEDPRNVGVPIQGYMFWLVKLDGSLRNFGAELISVPLRNEAELISALLELKKLLKEVKGYDFSWRSSIHVHICPLPYNAVSIGKFFPLLFTLEPLFFKVFSEERRDSVFCVPLEESVLKFQSVEKLVKLASQNKDCDNWIDFLKEDWNERTKYSSVNFMRISDIGTIEFRHLRGTDSIETISAWISVIQLMMKYALDVDFEDLNKTIFSLNSTSKYAAFLDKVFKDFSKGLQIPDFEKYLEEGIKRAKILLTWKLASLKISKKGALFLKRKGEEKKREERAKLKFKVDYL